VFKELAQQMEGNNISPSSSTTSVESAASASSGQTAAAAAAIATQAERQTRSDILSSTIEAAKANTNKQQALESLQQLLSEHGPNISQEDGERITMTIKQIMHDAKPQKMWGIINKKPNKEAKLLLDTADSLYNTIKRQFLQP
jgi:hypothetical protein